MKNGTSIYSLTVPYSYEASNNLQSCAIAGGWRENNNWAESLHPDAPDVWNSPRARHCHLALQSGCQATTADQSFLSPAPLPRPRLPVAMHPGQSAASGASPNQRNRGSMLVIKSFGQNEETMVQFASSMFFCHDTDGFVDVTVIRMSNIDAMCSVDFITQDDTAVAGLNYEGTRGSVLFGPGEYEQTLQIPIVQASVWQPMLRFSVKLISQQTSPVQNSLLTCKVHIVHNRAFPTENIGSAISVLKSDHTDASSVTRERSPVMLLARVKLYLEFVRKCYAVAHVRAMTPKQLLTDAFSNFVFLLQVRCVPQSNHAHVIVVHSARTWCVATTPETIKWARTLSHALSDPSTSSPLRLSCSSLSTLSITW